MPATLEVLDTDITRLDVEAIANAANTRLHHGGGVALAIAQGAGAALIDESEQRAPIGLGEAIETTGGDLPARWVIHAATMHPDGQTGAAVIAKATAATLARAESLGVRSLGLVAFGTGVGGFPLDQAAELEVAEVRRHLADGSVLERIVFAVRGEEAREAFARGGGGPLMAGGLHPPFSVPEDDRGPGALPGPTRPDRIAIWPVEEDRFGIDVLYHGATGFKRADHVHRQLDDAGVANLLRQEPGNGWVVRFGPVGRDEMLTVLNGFVW